MSDREQLRQALARELYVLYMLRNAPGQDRQQYEAAWDAPGEFGRASWLMQSDALLPVIDAHMQAERERIAAVRTLGLRWLRLSGEANDPDVREWTAAAGVSVLAALDETGSAP